MRRILHGEVALFRDDAADEFSALVKRVLAMQHERDAAPADPATPPAPAAPPAPVAPATPAPPTFNPAIIDRVTRYEGPLEKAFYRALRELLDLQSRRRARTARRPTASHQTADAENAN